MTLTRGMEEDLTTFPAEDSGQIAALANSACACDPVYLHGGGLRRRVLDSHHDGALPGPEGLER